MFTTNELEYIYNCVQACHDEFDDLVDMPDEETHGNHELYKAVSDKIRATWEKEGLPLLRLTLRDPEGEDTVILCANTEGNKEVIEELETEIGKYYWSESEFEGINELCMFYTDKLSGKVITNNITVEV